MEGIINLLKTSGMTSHDCVNSVRRLLGEKRVGHTGTLDPMACGVLPLCIGKATRLAEYSHYHQKEYRAEMIIGFTSDTQDTTGEIISRKKAPEITEEKILEALDKFVGPLAQVAPAYSAVKHQGKKLYELARRGDPVPKKTRNIVVHKLSLFRYYPSQSHPRAIVDIICSKGTYVRTLCSDIGAFLGPGAVMSFLVRTASGPFRLKNTFTLEEIEQSLHKGKYDFLMPMGMMVEHLPCIHLKPSAVKYIKDGTSVNSQYFTVREDIPDNSLVRLEHEGQLVGIAALSQGADSACLVRPKKVLI